MNTWDSVIELKAMVETNTAVSGVGHNSGENRNGDDGNTADSDMPGLVSISNNQESHLLNKKIVITGTLSSYSRNELKETLEKMGAKVSSAVSKNTDYLISGSDPGSKIKKASELNIQIIDEDKLSSFLQNG